MADTVSATQPTTTTPTDAETARPGPGLRVAHVVLSLDVGGLERVVLDLLREGRRLGHHTTVLCLERPGRQAPEAESLGATVLCANKQPGLRPGAVKPIRRLFEDLRPDVVHTHQAAALLYAGRAARQAGVPAVVHTEHNNHLRKRQGRFGALRTKLLGRVAARSADRIFCVSRDVYDAVTGHGVYPAARTSVVYNGIDLSPYAAPDDRVALRASLGIPAGAPLAGTVGRINEVKRQDLLIRAFAALRPAQPDAHLLLVGDGPQMGELRNLTADLGLEGVVHFAGYQSRPAPFLKAMDAFAVTSRIEGLPLSILEAWAAGAPVVASRVGGIPEVVEDGRTGLLFDFGDQPALVNHLSRLLADRPFAAGLADAARRDVRARFGSTVMADAYHRHYLEVLRGRSAPASAAAARTAASVPA